MTKGIITKSMLDNLKYDHQSKEMSNPTKTISAGQPLATPTALFVFDGADLNAAAYHFIQSLKFPFSAGAIASLFVQESVRERFIDILKPKLPEYSTEIVNQSGYKKALQTVARLNSKTVAAQATGGAGDNAGALLVFDVTHEYLGQDEASGVVTVHTFRTAKEAIALFSKETLVFENSSIWNENHSCAYELVAGLRCHNFFINCNQVSLQPVETQAAAGGNFVALDNSYHYETLSVNGLQKNVVFSIGTIFAN